MKRRFIATVRGGRRARPTCEVEVEFSGGATTMNHNVGARGALGRERRGGGRQRPGHGPGLGHRRTWPTSSWVVPDDPPGPLDHGPADRRATRSSSATPPPGRPPIGRRSSPRRSSRRRRSTSSATRRSSRRRGPSSRRRPPADRDRPPSGARRAGYDAPARPAGRRTRTGGAPAEAAPARSARSATAVVSGGPSWPTVPRPRVTSTSRRATAGTARTRRTTTSTCRPTSGRRRS